MSAESKKRPSQKENVVRPMNSEIMQILVGYEELGKKYKNPPEVQLSLTSQKPNGTPIGVVDIAVSTAIQCYAPGKALMTRRTKQHERGIAKSTREAGHLTTRMHVHLTWRMAGVSRATTHDIFHSHPFYNTEQQSQRYVRAENGAVLTPADLTKEQEEIYEGAASYANQAYFDLLEATQPAIENRLKRVSPKSAWKEGTSNRSRMEDKKQKIAQEVSRYALPIGQQTTFFHTLSHLQLLRMWRASKMSHVTDEGRYVVGQMIKSVAEVDPTILEELEPPIESFERDSSPNEQIRAHKTEFDAKLDREMSVVVNIPDKSKEILADAVRTTLRRTKEDLPDVEALQMLLSPKENPLLADVYDTGMQEPMTAALRQISLTFNTKLSHTADSQRQRHRRTPGATPPGELLYCGDPDYITPMVIAEAPVLKEKYDAIMTQMYANVEKALEAGIPREQALLLLPNAHAIRVQETGDLFDWMHRWKQRLCFLAQEEIFFVTVDQVKALNKKLPQARGALLAPCGLRKNAGQKPHCPEGGRFCGQQVYHWQIEKYSQERVV